jgi:hypothetical protein
MCGIEPPVPGAQLDPNPRPSISNESNFGIEPLLWVVDPLRCGIDPEPKCGIEPLVWGIEPLV